MRRWWYILFPLMFLPNLGFSAATSFGTFELSDVFIVPFLILLWIAADKHSSLNVNRLTLVLVLFLYWALLSTVTIWFRYDYWDTYYITLGVLKVAKWSLYAFAGILIARALTTPRRKELYHWSLLVSAAVYGIGLLTTKLPSDETLNPAAGYSATNAISVGVAIFLSYLGGLYLIGAGTTKWRRAAPWVLITLIMGASLSDGRGGWVAAIAAAIYLAFRLGPSREVVLAALTGVVIVAALYGSFPQFKDQVDKTLFPPETTRGYQGTRNVGTLDDGARFQTWFEELPKFLDSPVFGTGFFHRGGESSLYSTGSHNFLLQMFLELGIVGGGLMLALFVTMWHQASRLALVRPKQDAPLKAALIAALLGSLGGEYFYGGVVLLSLLSVYATCGSELVQKHNLVKQRLQDHRSSALLSESPKQSHRQSRTARSSAHV